MRENVYKKNKQDNFICYFIVNYWQQDKNKVQVTVTTLPSSNKIILCFLLNFLEYILNYVYMLEIFRFF